MGGMIERQMNVGGGPPIFVMNGENYHQIGSLLPMPGGTPNLLNYTRMTQKMRSIIEYNDASSSISIKREHVILREWLAYRIQQCDTEESIMLYGRPLFQQLLVDGYSMV